VGLTLVQQGQRYGRQTISH